MAAATPLFDKVVLIGIGLIGSSLARAIKKFGLAREVFATARSQESCDTALRLGFVDGATTDIAAAVVGSDLVVLCSPMGTYAAIIETIADNLETGAILSDVGSVKLTALRDLAPRVPAGVHLVPGHPVAGTEHSGPESGFAEIFENRWCVLTPPPGTEAEPIARLRALWEACGMQVEEMDAAHHDAILAMTSHLPHLIAYSIVTTATDLGDDMRAEVFKFSAGGFRDFTRIAGSNPVMWRDIFLHNRDAVLDVLGRFNEDLTVLQRAIRRGDGEALEEIFTRTRSIRRGVLGAGQAGSFSTTEPSES